MLEEHHMLSGKKELLSEFITPPTSFGQSRHSLDVTDRILWVKGVPNVKNLKPESIEMPIIG